MNTAFSEYATLPEAEKACPLAVVIAITKDKRFIPFTTYDDYQKWKDAQ